MSATISQQDIEEIGSLCPRLYDSVGWGSGKSPDWDAFRACCHPSARLVPMGSGSASPVSVEDFITGMEAQRESGAVADLREVELGRAVQAYGNLANVRSAFLATINGDERRGVTFAHVVREGGVWVILDAIWENERDGQPLPDALI
ncbi:MAG: nuclear transport factor 2 family protein [Allosphingosinicella sp.]|uniref:nuclear transport factor 2 family protein n=1 Tax=Allosphingosinicella sp. TaxID=2823234 RepID=UPI003921C848